MTDMEKLSAVVDELLQVLGSWCIDDRDNGSKLNSLRERLAPISKALPLPIITLRVECEQCNPPKPDGFVAMFEGHSIGVLEADVVMAAVSNYQRLQANREASLCFCGGLKYVVKTRMGKQVDTIPCPDCIAAGRLPCEWCDKWYPIFEDDRYSHKLSGPRWIARCERYVEGIRKAL